MLDLPCIESVSSGKSHRCGGHVHSDVTDPMLSHERSNRRAIAAPDVEHRRTGPNIALHERQEVGVPHFARWDETLLGPVDLVVLVALHPA